MHTEFRWGSLLVNGRWKTEEVEKWILGKYVVRMEGSLVFVAWRVLWGIHDTTSRYAGIY
jgi:hypothetical protein